MRTIVTMIFLGIWVAPLACQKNAVDRLIDQVPTRKLPGVIKNFLIRVPELLADEVESLVLNAVQANDFTEPKMQDCELQNKNGTSSWKCNGYWEVCQKDCSGGSQCEITCNRRVPRASEYANKKSVITEEGSDRPSLAAARPLPLKIIDSDSLEPKQTQNLAKNEQKSNSSMTTNFTSNVGILGQNSTNGIQNISINNSSEVANSSDQFSAQKSSNETLNLNISANSSQGNSTIRLNSTLVGEAQLSNENSNISVAEIKIENTQNSTNSTPIGNSSQQINTGNSSINSTLSIVTPTSQIVKNINASQIMNTSSNSSQTFDSKIAQTNQIGPNGLTVGEIISLKNSTGNATTTPSINSTITTTINETTNVATTAAPSDPNITTNTTTVATVNISSTENATKISQNVTANVTIVGQNSSENGDEKPEEKEKQESSEETQEATPSKNQTPAPAEEKTHSQILLPQPPPPKDEDVFNPNLPMPEPSPVPPETAPQAQDDSAEKPAEDKDRRLTPVF